MSRESRASPKAEQSGEAEALEALRRFRAAEKALADAVAEYDASVAELNDKLKAVGWPLMVVSKR